MVQVEEDVSVCRDQQTPFSTLKSVPVLFVCGKIPIAIDFPDVNVAYVTEAIALSCRYDH